MAAVHSLSESDVAALREELSTGKPPTVWFTSIAVGVPVGGSAKVMSVGEVAEGDFIEVKPTGSKDTMFCSPNELTRTRSTRKRAPRPAAAQPEPEPAPERAEPAPKSTPARRSTPAVAEPAAVVAGSGDPSVTDEPPVPSVRRSSNRRPPTAEVTVTLSGSAEGEWTVEVTVGKKRVVRSAPVQPAEVAKASRSLPAPVAEAIEASLAVARDRQADRIKQLRAELEAAQRALRELST